MNIIGKFTRKQPLAQAPTGKLRERLGLRQKVFPSSQREDGDCDFFLFTDQGLVLNFKGAPKVVLNRKETAMLFSFLTQKRLKPYMMALCRAKLLEGSAAARRCMELLDQHLGPIEYDDE